MKRAALLLPVIGFAIIAASSYGRAGQAPDTPRLRKAEADTGWKLLFDGKSLDGWGILGAKEGWAVEDGAIACTVKHGNYIYTNESFKDFSFRCEFKTDRKVNSGIFVRWEDLQDPVNSGMEIQILDSFGRVKPDKHDCGA